ncbi:DoxX family protein [Domibacillus indicus]|uniref:DoxX family protein n=1 Tax=Domibacillus indicus TaxID=1437523 RepID=UPI000617EE75|nr:DoxX family protein [Domibacillus indicus]
MNSKMMAAVWTVLRVWLGVQWIQAGWHKVADGFDASGFLYGAIEKASGDMPAVSGWYAGFLENAALPNVSIINVLVPWGELLVGIALIAGVFTVPALIAGAFMNLNFLWAGTVSTNPTLLLAAVVLLFAAKGAMYYGGDRFLLPVLAKKMNEWKNNHPRKHIPKSA